MRLRNRRPGRFVSLYAVRSLLRFIALLVCSAASGADSPAIGPAVEHLSHGRFHDVAVYAQEGAHKSFVLLLSSEGERVAGAAELARELAQRGALVAIVDVSSLDANFEADPGDCVFADGDFENLSHFLQAYYHLPTYLTPFLVGYGAGAGLAYATLAQAPADTFAGALTLGFCPALSLRKPLCKGSGVEFAPREGEGALEVLPAKQLQKPWVALASASDAACPTADAAGFVAKIRGAALVPLPHLKRDYTPATAWMPQFLAAFDTLVGRAAANLAPLPPASLSNLPVIEVPAQAGAAPVDEFAIIMSGDGGWAGLDKEVAQALSAAGIPVVGLDSLRYFWSARTPDGLAADTDRMIRYYLTHLNKRRVLLIGYSQGADVLPFAVNRLPAATRARVALTALMGMSEHALFEFHVTSWISASNSGPATLPEVDRIGGTPVLCIYGEDDRDSLCPKLDPQKVQIMKLKGGHHFNGDYAALARAILAAAKP